jgi:membrane protease YdiL (CAAX protease family)
VIIAAKKVIHVFAAGLAALVLVYFVQWTPVLITLRVAHRIPTWMEPRILTYVAQLCLLGVVFVALRALCSRREINTGDHVAGVRAVAWLTMAGVLVSGVVVFSLLSTTSFQDAARSFSSLMTRITSDYPVWGLGGWFVGHVVIGPVFEEFLFRGLILGFLFRGPNRWLGLLISSVLFASVHTNWIFAAVGGLCYGLLYLRYRNILVCILAHSLNNLAVAALVPLGFAYLLEARYFMPIQTNLWAHQIAWLTVAFACFLMFLTEMFRNGFSAGVMRSNEPTAQSNASGCLVA